MLEPSAVISGMILVKNQEFCPKYTYRSPDHKQFYVLLQYEANEKLKISQTGRSLFAFHKQPTKHKEV